MTEFTDSLDLAVDRLLATLPGPLHVGAPLGIGKPHRLLNALYGRVERDGARELHLYTALSLDPPSGGEGLEGRFIGPLVSRLYGEDFERLAYVQAQKRDSLPSNITVEEFYMQSGALMGSRDAQRRYASLNYTHVARALADRGVNCIVQKVAARVDDTIYGELRTENVRLSLSSNTDLTFDAIDAIMARGLPRPLLIAEIDPQLPWLDGMAAVDADFFDIVIAPPAPHPTLFALPRQPVGDAEHAIGLYASALVRDGGTLQIGIGALSDALCHALVLRHTDNAAYRRVMLALDPAIESHPSVIASGGLGPLPQGLYGCSEMINEGFKRLVETGVIRRKVVDKLPLMQRVDDGSASELDRELLERDGEFLHGAFYLGSQDFYDWLHGLDDDTRRGIGMRRVSEVNELYGGNEALERAQRRDARFFNTCMMATALGAAVSDGLDDGRVVSGVGGQYNFVAMAHALPDARSVLLLRATRDGASGPESNIRWNYGHTTIPRHLRDIYISEYGIADLRGRNDEDCIASMAGIAAAPFGAALLATGAANRKCAVREASAATPPAGAANTPSSLRARLAPFRSDGTLPDYPLGSDFTDVEQRLVKALGWLKANTLSRASRLSTVAKAVVSTGLHDREAMERMGLTTPSSMGERVEAALLRYALRRC